MTVLNWNIILPCMTMTQWMYVSILAEQIAANTRMRNLQNMGRESNQHWHGKVSVQDIGQCAVSKATDLRRTRLYWTLCLHQKRLRNYRAFIEKYWNVTISQTVSLTMCCRPLQNRISNTRWRTTQENWLWNHTGMPSGYIEKAGRTKRWFPECSIWTMT